MHWHFSPGDQKASALKRTILGYAPKDHRRRVVRIFHQTLPVKLPNAPRTSGNHNLSPQIYSGFSLRLKVDNDRGSFNVAGKCNQIARVRSIDPEHPF